jgi:hypothetical protein
MQVAEPALAQGEVKIGKGGYLSLYEEKKLTFRQFAPDYLAYSQANKSRISYQRDRITFERWLMPAFGDQYLFQVTLADGERCKQDRLKVVDPATVNKELNCLKAMLNKAAAWGYLQTHPLRGMKGLKSHLDAYAICQRKRRFNCWTPARVPHISLRLSRLPCIRACDARKFWRSAGRILISAAAR